MTQVSRFGTILKLKIEEVRMRVTTRFRMEGSALAGSIRGYPLEFDCRMEIISPEPPERVQKLIRMAHNSCFVLQSLLMPVTVHRAVTLNGQVLVECEQP